MVYVKSDYNVALERWQHNEATVAIACAYSEAGTIQPLIPSALRANRCSICYQIIIIKSTSLKLVTT